ncbi:hypothetical protein B0H19DRAFT_1060027 [Mycena capillaripes]|nr:hypothetical protein B0H19DRAFT_1060027 [Mycena capillaripes]
MNATRPSLATGSGVRPVAVASSENRGLAMMLPSIALPPAHCGASRPSCRVLPVPVFHHSGAITTLASVDSVRGKLAGTFVNTFVNAGFGNEKLVVEAEVGNSWVYKNKWHGMMSTTASLGLSLLWDTDLGLSQVNKYTYLSEEYIKAGALLATGILNSGVCTEADVAKGIIGEYGDSKSVRLKTSAIMGLALAYAGSHCEDLLRLLVLPISDDGVTMEIAILATLTLGLIFVGSENGENWYDPADAYGEGGEERCWARCKVGKVHGIGSGASVSRPYWTVAGAAADRLASTSDTTIETLKAIEHPISVVEACAFVGTGNVLKVQAMLHHCDEHIYMKEKEALDKDKDKEEEKKDEPADGATKKEAKPDVKSSDTFQSFTVIAVMHYGEPIIRKSVPLAIGLVSISSPQLPILDTLSKYSHDNDLAVAFNVILAMGLVGAITNNARLAQMLRQLAGYYYKEPDCLFMVRVAQRLVHMSKSTIGLNPFFSDRSIMNRPAMAGLLATLTVFTDVKHSDLVVILNKYHCMMYRHVPPLLDHCQ